MRVVDKREIEFDGESIAFYLSILPQEAQLLGLPPAGLSSIRFDPQDATVEAVYEIAGQTQSVHLPIETLSAILVNYCIRTRIPLPRVADKVIRVEARCVVLSFKTWFDEAPVFDAKDPASRSTATTKSWKWFDCPEVSLGQAATG